MNNSMSHRILAVQEMIAAASLDGILLINMNNIRYLTGFSGSDGVLILCPGRVVLLVDGRYTTQASSEAMEVNVVEYKNKIQGIRDAILEFGLKEIGFEASFVSVETYNDLAKCIEPSKLVPLADSLRQLRAVKDDLEIFAMKKAAAIGSDALASLSREIKVGWTEKEAALQLEVLARRAGAEQIAFETIMASGENASLPHAKPSHRRFRKGDFVVMDFGVRYQGYCSDETCTFAFGELTGDQKNAYRAVQRAHDEAIAIIQAGMAAADVDASVRRFLGEKYSPFFVHGTGHGVGLEVHEAPRLGPNSPDILKSGMVITVEPGLYYPGLWGIRIEDTVIVKEKGCEKITTMDKRLLIIE